jgi:hypothetical protein
MDNHCSEQYKFDRGAAIVGAAPSGRLKGEV